MATLLMRISAPLQSWGTQSNFSHRDTGSEPSKSGIVGLLCAALGRPRSESIADLVELRMGVRVDQPGTILRDYHTAGQGGYYKVGGGIGKNTILSHRYYLADAKFLVGLEGDRALLDELWAALKQPTWFLFFGRKSFVPAERVWLPDGLCDDDLETALSSYPWLGQGNNPSKELRLIIEDVEGPIFRNDQPARFAFQSRRFLPRYLREYPPIRLMNRRHDHVSIEADD